MNYRCQHSLERFRCWWRQHGGVDGVSIAVDGGSVNHLLPDEELGARLELGYGRRTLRIELAVRLGNSLRIRRIIINLRQR